MLKILKVMKAFMYEKSQYLLRIFLKISRLDFKLKLIYFKLTVDDMINDTKVPILTTIF